MQQATHPRREMDACIVLERHKSTRRWVLPNEFVVLRKNLHRRCSRLNPFALVVIDVTCVR